MAKHETLFIGIDPDLHGAAACLDERGRVRWLMDTPTVKVKGRAEACIPRQMADVLPKPPPNSEIRAFTEKVWARPGQNCSSMGRMMLTAGVWLGVLAAYGIPVEEVPARRWKKAMGVPETGDKDASRGVAMGMFPCQPLNLKKHHGRADALLIAEYGRRLIVGAK